MKEKGFYNNSFYNEQESGSYISAQRLLPLVFNVFKPLSVIDIGCGVGYWLRVCQNLGAREVLGVEGPHLTKELFRLNPMELQTADLKFPLNLSKRYDLAISMEVAEHLPENSADVFVQNLVKASDIILFSAAIVAQKGTYHINEQMPEYWAKKFLQHDYSPIDYLRPRIWNDNNIEYWYRQNSIIYLKNERLADFPELEFDALATNPDFLLRIHPEKYFEYVREVKQLSTIPGWILNKKNKLARWIKGHKK